MRHAHVDNPLHRIQQWTGTYFRSASLWEVGVSIVIPHSQDSAPCQSLRWQIDLLEAFQKAKDHNDGNNLDNTGGLGNAKRNQNVTGKGDNAATVEKEADADTTAFFHLQQLFDQQKFGTGTQGDNILEEDDEEGIADGEADISEDVAGSDFFRYMPESLNRPVKFVNGIHISSAGSANAPTTDAFNNQYV